MNEFLSIGQKEQLHYDHQIDKADLVPALLDGRMDSRDVTFYVSLVDVIWDEYNGNPRLAFKSDAHSADEIDELCARWERVKAQADSILSVRTSETAENSEPSVLEMSVATTETKVADTVQSSLHRLLLGLEHHGIDVDGSAPRRLDEYMEPSERARVYDALLVQAGRSVITAEDAEQDVASLSNPDQQLIERAVERAQSVDREHKVEDGKAQVVDSQAKKVA